MKVLFIVPTIPQLRIRKTGKPIGSKIFRVPFLGIMTAASCVTREHEVTVIDEHIEEINFDMDCDIVGLTVATPTAKRTYEIAQEFSKRKKKVFAGGFHPTFNKEEALEHLDSVVIGEAEGNIQRLMADFENGQLQPVYENEDFCDPADIPMIRQELIRYPQHYFTTNVTHMSRGCVYNCSFCGVRLFHKNTYRKRPIDHMIEEIKSFKGKKFIFTDDNLIGDPEYTKELFRRMIPLKKWWMGQMSIDCINDKELLTLAAKSGCLGVFIGFETINKDTIKSIDKSQNNKANYKQVITTLHDHGISVAAGTMFGFENDEKAVFKETLKFFLDAKLDCIQVDPVTPFPGMPLFHQYESEGRLITRDWDKYNIAETTYMPNNMMPQELDQGLDKVRRGFYTLPNMIKRIFRVLFLRGFAAALIIGYFNFGYWNHLKKNIGYPP